MCGIFAYFGNRIPKKELDESLSRLSHRGPDNQNYEIINDDAYLGHTRLSIIDLNARSNQPFRSGDFHLVYNGEIYNYIELIKEHNLCVKTPSDTEVLIEMYKKYGEKCLNYFNGMFAFVIYNAKTKNFFVGRDRLGIKPLYYSETSVGILFSSEIAPIQTLINSDLDEFGLRQYRKLRISLKGYTVYKDIRVFPPGCYYKNGYILKFWSLDYSEKPAPNDDNIEALIDDSVNLRKRSDVCVGSYLSGGLDSTILSALLKPDDTWTVGFKDCNEFDWALKANSKIKSKHHQVIVEKEEFIETAKWMITKRKEPLSVPNEVLIYLMTKKVKKKNTVVLSGEGADELFWGYDRIFKWANSISAIKISEFDMMYCYGSNIDDEVVDFALEGLSGSPLQRIGYFFQTHHLQGLLRRLDNSTMLCGVEGRVPFVDHRLVEALAGVPFDWKMGQSVKEPLKRIFKNLIPASIIERKKVGFPVPLDTIFQNKATSKGSPMDSWLNFNLEKFT